VLQIAPENAVRFRVGHELDHSIDISLQSARCWRGTGTFRAVIDPFFFRLIFVRPTPASSGFLSMIPAIAS